MTNFYLSLCQKNAVAMACVALSVASFVVAAFIYGTHWSGETSPYLALFLLVVPLLQTIIITLFSGSILRNALSIPMALSLLSYEAAWICYSLKVTSTWFWLVCVSLSFVLVAIAFVVSWLIMRSPGLSPAVAPPQGEGQHQNAGARLHPAGSDDHREKFRTEVRKHTFLTICFFLGLFFSVTYLLSFAFALHDRSQKAEGYVGLCAAEDPPRTAASVPKATSSIQGPLQASPPHIHQIYFAVGQAVIETDYEGAVEWEDKYRTKTNYYNVDILRSTFVGLDRKKRYRMTVIGHADDTDFKPGTTRFKSNQELSEARASATVIFLSRLFYPRTVAEWSTQSSPEFRGQKPTRREEWRSSEVLIEELEDNSTETLVIPSSSVACKPDMDLNDYIYFTVYTVTTTGYGDIRPVTGEAKFITSLANYFEVFFFVLFFNILISSHRRPDESSDALQQMVGKIEDASRTLFAVVAKMKKESSSGNELE